LGQGGLNDPKYLDFGLKKAYLADSCILSELHFLPAQIAVSAAIGIRIGIGARRRFIEFEEARTGWDLVYSETRMDLKISRVYFEIEDLEVYQAIPRRCSCVNILLLTKPPYLRSRPIMIWLDPRDTLT